MGGVSSLVQSGTRGGASPDQGGCLSKEPWEESPEHRVAPAFLCVHLVFRFKDSHQMAHQPDLGETGVLWIQSPELLSKELPVWALPGC